MELHSSSGRSAIFAICFSVIVTAVALTGFSTWLIQKKCSLQTSSVAATSTSSSVSNKDATDQAYRDGYNAARTRLAVMNALPANDQTTSLEGVVVSIDAGSLIVRQTNLDTDPRVDGVADERNVTLSATTRFFNSVQTSPAELAAKLTTFEQEKTQHPDALPPTASIRQPILLSDIHVGDRVRISATTPVRLATQIEAVEIQSLH